jgi:hypothetical protein
MPLPTTKSGKLPQAVPQALVGVERAGDIRLGVASHLTEQIYTEQIYTEQIYTEQIYTGQIHTRRDAAHQRTADLDRLVELEALVGRLQHVSSR